MFIDQCVQNCPNSYKCSTKTFSLQLISSLFNKQFAVAILELPFAEQIFGKVMMCFFSFSSFSYNFLVGGDGAIYVGRSWNNLGAHTKGYNVGSICFAFIGTYNTVEPKKKQLVAVQKMMVEGVKLGKLTADYSLYGHRQLISTQSPGQALYEIIQRWDHWTNKPDASP